MDKIKFSGRYNANMINKSWVNITSPHITTTKILMIRFKKPIKVAVMGCAVNGPGEAREADFGIAGGVGSGLVFRKGKVIRSVPENELIDALMEEIEKFETEGEN